MSEFQVSHLEANGCGNEEDLPTRNFDVEHDDIPRNCAWYILFSDTRNSLQLPQSHQHQPAPMETSIWNGLITVNTMASQVWLKMMYLTF